MRWETPYLAALQNAVRTPALDSYFAITANLGTHTFFMVGLPVLFWCGFRDFGKGYGRPGATDGPLPRALVLGPGADEA